MYKRKGGFAPFLLIALLPILGPAACVAAEPIADTHSAPAKVLFVGNSFTYYNNSLHNHYRALVEASEATFSKPTRARSLTISGGRLPEHLGGFANMVRSDDWDAVIMQGHSRGPITEATAGPFQDTARDFATIIRAQGAEPVFFMTWAYTGKPEMTAQLDDAYTRIGTELSATVVPVGLAFEKVTNEYPDIDLRTSDALHPTLEGTYLAACTFFAVLHASSPEGLSYNAGLGRDTALKLQRAAWQAVASYQQREMR